MKVLITGGAGYVGTELVDTLTQLPDITEIVVYDNLSRRNFNLFLSEKFSPKRIKFVHGDILDSRKLRKCLSEGVDVVFHLAARVSTPFANEDPHTLEQTNHWGTAELSYALEAHPVKKLFFLSTTSVYEAVGEIIYEDTLPSPRTFYGKSKLNGEKMLSRIGDKMDVIILRTGNVYGYSKSMRFDAVINKFMFGAHFNKKIIVEGSGHQKRAFIPINKLTGALSALLFGNVGTGVYTLFDKNLSINTVAATMQQLYPDAEILYLQQGRDHRSIEFSNQNRISALNLFSQTELIDDLQNFKSHFAFATY